MIKLHNMALPNFDQAFEVMTNAAGCVIETEFM